MLHRLYGDHMKQEGKTAASIYVDISAAFDSLPRMDTFKYLQDQGVNNELLQKIMAAHQQTWMSMEGVDDIKEATRGTKAGDPFGTVVWNSMMAAKLEEIQTEMERRDFATELPTFDEGSMFQPEAQQYGAVKETAAAFVDDCVFMMNDKKASEMETTVKDAMAEVHGAMKKAGLEVNYAKGKTEVTISYRGRGSAEQKATLPESFQVQTEEGVRELRTTKYLGAYVTHDNTLDKEIEYRRGQAKSAIRELRAVLKDPRLGKKAAVGGRENLHRIKAVLRGRYVVQGTAKALQDAEPSNHDCDSDSEESLPPGEAKGNR